MGFFGRKPKVESIPGRGVITYYGRGHDLGEEPPEKGTKHRIKFDVRVTQPRAREETDSIKAWLESEVLWLLREGLEIPIQVDPRTGEGVGVDNDTVAQELAGRMDEFEAAYKHATSLGYQFEFFRDDTKPRA